MPVIREQRRYEIGRVGVARTFVNPYVRNNAGVTGNAIAQGADELAGLFYKEGARLAEKAGIEMGNTVDRQSIMSFNPETGEPEAYEAPGNFGTIASEAYQRVVLSRFQASMEEEIKNKGKVLAAQYAGNIGGYTQAMSEYIAAMSNNATGMFGNYIKDVGTSYLNSTRASMAVQQIKAERAAAAAAARARIAQANDAAYLMARRGGAAAFADNEPGAIITAGAEALEADGATAGLFDAADLKGMGTDRLLAVARGLFENNAMGIEDPEDLKLLKAAAGMADIETIAQLAPDAAVPLSLLANNPSALVDFGKDAEKFAIDAIAAAEVRQKRELEAAKEIEDGIRFEYDNGIFAKVTNTIRSAMSDAERFVPSSVRQYASENYNALLDRAREFVTTNPELANSIEARAGKVLDAATDALATQAVTAVEAAAAAGGPSIDLGIAQLEEAILKGDPSLAPAAAQSAVKAIIRLDRDVGEGRVRTGAEQFFGSYLEGGGRAAEARIAQEATGIAKDRLDPIINTLPFATAEDFQTRRDTALELIASIPGLDVEDYTKALDSASALARLNLAIADESMRADRGIDQAKQILEGRVVDGPLSENAVNNLIEAYKYGKQSDSMSALRTSINSASDFIASGRVAEERAAKDRSMEAEIRLRSGQPESQTYRVKAEELIASDFGIEEPLVSYLTNPANMQSSQYGEVVSSIRSLNVMPDTVFNLFETSGAGGFTGVDQVVVNNLWTNLSKTDVGTLSPAVAPLGDKAVSRNNAIVEATRIIGTDPERIAEYHRKVADLEADPNAEAALAKVLGENTLDDYLSNIASDIPMQYWDGIRGAIAVRVSSGLVAGESRQAIRRAIERQINETYVNAEGYVATPLGSDRSPYALSRTAFGHEDEFKDYVRDMVSKFGRLEDGSTFGRFVLNGDWSPFQLGMAQEPVDGAEVDNNKPFVNRVVLVPQGGDLGNTQYLVAVRSGTGVYTETVYKPDGTPLIVSPSEPSFLYRLGIYKPLEVQRQEAQEAYDRRTSFIKKITGISVMEMMDRPLGQ